MHGARCIFTGLRMQLTLHDKPQRDMLATKHGSACKAWYSPCSIWGLAILVGGHYDDEQLFLPQLLHFILGHVRHSQLQSRRSGLVGQLLRKARARALLRAIQDPACARQLRLPWDNAAGAGRGPWSFLC